MDIYESKKIRLIMYLRQAGITDTNVLSALERVPRQDFVPDALLDQSYEDRALPIGRGQTISQPLVVALMTQTLELTDRHKVLEIGTGSGYQTAILSKLCRRVYTIERHRFLMELAQAQFEKLALRNVTTQVGDGMKGWPVQAPFDRIIVTAAAVEKPPQALLDQLAVGGIMIVPVGKKGETHQVLRRYKRETDDTFAVRDFLDVRFVPLLPEIARDTEEAAIEDPALSA